MSSLVFIVLWLVVGFLAGLYVGHRHGYESALKDLDKIFNKLEKFYQDKLEGYERKLQKYEQIIRERLVGKV